MAALNEKILPHFHIPLQSGCNKILGLMRRRYSRELFSERVDMIRKMLPFAGIGADVIVGFPGETDDDFVDYLFFPGRITSFISSRFHIFRKAGNCG